MDIYGYVYLTINLLNGKRYVGQTIQWSSLNIDYLGSGKLILKAIQKFGKENFKIQLLEYVFEQEGVNPSSKRVIKSQKILNERESYWIEKLKTKKDYNLKLGQGSYGKMPEETKERIGKGNKGNKSWNKGRISGPRSEDTKRKISEGMRGRVVSEETREKIRQGNLGWKHTSEAKEKIRQAVLKRYGDIA